ncbi:MAG: WD40 repeat domain-containing protein [Anaerolineales bacterium]|nr:WD40 repeat domain-containing protein [Anaerolineales bacterium]
MPIRRRAVQVFILLAIAALSFAVNVNRLWGQNAPSMILDVAWSPNGERLAMVDNSGTLRIRVSDQSTDIFHFTRPLVLYKASITWSPQGERLAAGIGNRMYIWNTTSWQLVYEFAVGDPDGFFTFDSIQNIPEGVQKITWSVDGRYVVVGTYSYETSVWDNQESRSIFQEGDLSGGGPGRVWLGDNGWLGDGATKVNVFSGELIVPSVEDIQNRYGGSAEGGATEPRPDNTQIAWGNNTGFLLIYNLNTLQGVNAIEVTDSIPPAPRRSIADISWDGTWNFIAVVSHDGELYIVNLLTEDVATVLNINGQLNAVNWNPTNNLVTYAGVSSTGESILETVDVSGIAGVPTVVPTPHPTPSGGFIIPPGDPVCPGGGGEWIWVDGELVFVCGVTWE